MASGPSSCYIHDSSGSTTMGEHYEQGSHSTGSGGEEHELSASDSSLSNSGSNVNLYTQQRAIHLYVMQQLLMHYTQTLQSFQNYITEETQRFSKDLANNTLPPASEYGTQIPTHLKQLIAQFETQQQSYSKYTSQLEEPPKNPMSGFDTSMLDSASHTDSAIPILSPSQPTSTYVYSATPSSMEYTYQPTPTQSTSFTSDPAQLQLRLQQLHQQQLQLNEIRQRIEQQKFQNQLLETELAPAPYSATHQIPSSPIETPQNSNPSPLVPSDNPPTPSNPVPLSPSPPVPSSTSLTKAVTVTSTMSSTVPPTIPPAQPSSAPSSPPMLTLNTNVVTPQLTPITPVLSTPGDPTFPQPPSKLTVESASALSPITSEPSPTTTCAQSPEISPSQHPSISLSSSEPAISHPLSSSQSSIPPLSSPQQATSNPLQSSQTLQSNQNQPNPLQNSTQLPQSLTQKQKPMKFHMVNYKKRPLSELTASNYDGHVFQRSQSLLPTLPTSLSSLPSEQLIHSQMQTLNQQFIHDHQQQMQQDPIHQPTMSQTVTKLRIYPELLTMKQADAAKILGISASMLSKRWREAMNGKKWPYRVHRKLQKEMDSSNTGGNDEEATLTAMSATSDEYIEI